MNKKYTVIIVEDEPPILISLKGMIDNSKTPFITEATSFNGKDGIKLIEEHKPHVVITDINMPIMDGLEMIAKAKRISPDTIFIILTGYDEFEYAQTALRLRVTDYILKPVRQKKLNDLLKGIAARIDYKDNMLESQYIKAELGLAHHSNKNIKSLSNTRMHIFFVYAGTVINKYYQELEVPIYNWELKNWEELKDKSFDTCDRIHIFNGKHPNELIIAAIWTSWKTKDIERLTNIIFKWAKCDQTFVNLGISEVINNGKDLNNKASKAMNGISNKIGFGKDGIIKQGNNENLNKHYISSKIEEEIRQLTFMSTEGQLSKKLKGIVEYWETQEYTQRQLITEMDYLFATVEQNAIVKTGDIQNKRLESDYLLVLANNYDNLYESILLRLREALILDVDINSARELVDKIQEYLDKNFASNITYKTLQDKFAYNQRYISNIFKQEKGITPSKYITKARINMAKTLMVQNPETLIKDIAQAVGYTDQLYFSRVFKEVTGKSPSSFIDETD